jgi:ABC-type sugar transport system ATPase subunit
MSSSPALRDQSPVLRVRGVAKSFGSVQALHDVDVDIRPREIHGLLGDNGAGKSTLVKVIAGVIQPDAGTIEVCGDQVTFANPREAEQAGIETVYQDLALAPALDAGENVFLGREILRSGLLGRLGFLDRPEMRRRAADQLDTLGIDLPSLKSETAALSGGQRQAVAVAKAAIWGRSLLLMDEPTAALGVGQTDFVLRLMERLRDEQGLSILFISHNLPNVMRVVDRLTVLRLGTPIFTGAIDEVTEHDLITYMTGAKSGSAKERGESS